MATPAARVPRPAAVPAPVQVPLVKKVKVTVPWAYRPRSRHRGLVGDTRAQGHRCDRRSARCTAVTVWLAALFTVNGSQAPVEVR